MNRNFKPWGIFLEVRRDFIMDKYAKNKLVWVVGLLLGMYSVDCMAAVPPPKISGVQPATIKLIAGGKAVKVTLKGQALDQFTGVKVVKNKPGSFQHLKVVKEIGASLGKTKGGDSRNVTLQAGNRLPAGSYTLRMLIKRKVIDIPPRVVSIMVIVLKDVSKQLQPLTPSERSPFSEEQLEETTSERLTIAREKQLIMSQNTFEKTLWPVFRHPRCTNCHSFESGKASKPPHSAFKRPLSSFICLNCHTKELTGDSAWSSPKMLSVQDMDWTFKGPGLACELMKTNFQIKGITSVNNIADLKRHLMSDDRIRWAIENRKTPNGVIQGPTPISTVAQLGSLFDRWHQKGKLRCK